MLLVFGSINIDFVFPLPRLPRAGDTIWSDGGRMEAGGKGANQAIAAARDSASVTFVGAVGKDVLAEVALAGMADAGVELKNVARVEAMTGRAAISVDPDGYTTVTVDSGANRHARAEQVPDAMLGPRTTLLVQLETDPAETAVLITRARRLGSQIVFLLSPARNIDWQAVKAVDILVGNSPELAWAGEQLGTGNNPGSLHAALGVTTVRMMGVQGAELVSDAGFLRMPAFSVQMRDTTAASDCFTGVLAAAIENRATLRQAIRRAAVAAALSTTRLGAQRSMPCVDEIDQALRRAPEPSSDQPEVPD